jgi:glycosyltransferase involved in cell wall biosynthesis
MELSAEKRTGSQLRVAFFGLLPVDNVPTRFFCERPARELEPFGIDGRLFVPSSVRLYHMLYRGKSRGWRLRAAVYWYLLVLPRRLWQIVSALRCDVIFIQRGLLRYNSPPVLELLVKLLAGKIARRRIVYHLDDALWVVSRPSYFRTRFRMADLVITGNEPIAEFAREAGATVEIVEYAVDVGRYPVKDHAERTSPVIGYTGTTPEQFLKPVTPALREACDRTGARIRVIGGDRPPSLDGLQAYVDWRQWRREDAFTLFQEFDMGIMPMEDTEANRAKEPFKVKEYMAAGLPVVSSPVGHNLGIFEHGEQGFFAGSADEWVTYLVKLAEDPGLRSEMGARGRNLVRTRYDYPGLLQLLADTFWRVSGRER